MLDDLLELAADLVGDTAVELVKSSTGKRRGRSGSAGRKQVQPQTGPWKTARTPQLNRTVGKTTARREKRGEDPWDWKEKRPPWEG